MNRRQSRHTPDEKHAKQLAAAKKTSVESVQNSFIDAYDKYTTSLVEQAENRVNYHIPDVESYLRIRRDDAGIKPCSRYGDSSNMVSIAMNDMGLDLDEAMLWISDFYDERVESFQETYAVMREDLPISERSETAILYLEGLGNWVRAQALMTDPVSQVNDTSGDT
ncbi:hypothetical protein FB446DRAFT_847402 [Lentinula raphanica]|nr:hypothetical protein FB446DRAFT_847402 [Lentinula raphanica]